MTESAAPEASPHELRRRGQSRMLSQLTAAGVRYALLRGGPGLGNDVDVLIHPADLRRLGSSAAAWDMFAAPSRRHWPHRFFVSHERGAGDDPTSVSAWIVADVVDRVVISGAFVGGQDLAAVLVGAAVRDDEGVSHLSPADTAWATLVHAALKGRSLRGGELSLPGIDSITSAFASAIDTRMGSGTAAGIVAALERHDDATATRSLATLATLPWPARDRAARGLHKWLDRLMWPRSSSQHLRGVNVALLGPDGAGKSTLAEGLRRVLPVPVRIVYMGVFRTDTAQHLWRRVPGAGLLLRVSRLWWRSTVARYHRARGAVVVFDRYVFDAKLRPGPKSPRSRASYWVIERACPAPDLVLLLDAPGAVMFERKGEHDVTTLEQRRGWYLDLVSKLPQGQVIDATLPPSGVLEAAVTAVWKAQSAA